jgi:hypothetical protein
MKDVFGIIHVCVVVVFQHQMEDNIQLILNLYEDFDMMILMKIFRIYDKEKVLIDWLRFFFHKKIFFGYFRIYAQIINWI